MSASVDNRIVSMQFNNKQFESNVQTSLGTLAKLRESLKLPNASKGFENISAASKNVDFSAMSGSIETVRTKFSALQVMAVTALANITNSAVNAGKRIASAFTVDPIKSGFAEYETQINSVQTILANTESKGTTLDHVNTALDTLNQYADKTIYNFTEMTKNIGTFTAAGIDLDKSVNSIQGIANLAAVSGSTSQQASTAMYQLSQALASGTVKLMDWNSVVNAGMGGQVFQDALKETARVHGVAIDSLIEKEGSFRETLQTGWLTADILTETLEKFTMTTEGLTEAEIDRNRAYLKGKGYTDEQIDGIFKLGETATNAATKVKTFTQLMDTLKEAAQSGWTQTWEYVVGDFEEAKELWTSVSDIFGGLINSSSEARNTMLEGAMTSNWDKLIKKLKDAGIETADFEKRVTKTAEEHGVNVDSMIEKYGSLEKAFRSGAISSDVLKEAIGSTSTKLKEAETYTVKSGDALGRIAQKYGMTVDELAKLNGITNVDLIKPGQILTISEAFDETTGSAEGLVEECSSLIDGIEELGGRELLIESLKNIFNGLVDVIRPIRDAFKTIFPPVTSEQLYKLLEGFRDLTSKFRLTDAQAVKLENAFKGVFSVFKIGLNFVTSVAKGVFKLLGSFSGLGNAVLNVGSAIGKWITGLSKSVEETDIFGSVIDKIVGFVQTVIGKIKQFTNAIKEKFTTPGFDGFLSVMSAIWNIVKTIGGKIGQVCSTIGKSLSGVLSGENISNALNIVNGGLITGILISIRKFFSNLTGSSEGGFGIIDNLKSVADSIKEIFEGLSGSLEAFQNNMKADTLKKIAVAIGILAASILVLSTIDPEKLAASLWTITALFGELLGAMAIFNKIGFASKGALQAVPVMIGMSTAILILASAVKSMSSLDWDGLVKGLIGVGILMAELAVFLNVAKFSKRTFKTAVGMIALAAAIKILASACKDFGQMKANEIIKGLGAIGIVLVELAAFTKLTGNAKKVVSTGAALVLIGTAMKIFASAVRDFASIPKDDLGKGLLGMAYAMGAVAIAVNLMPENMIGIGIGLTIVSGALIVLANALDKMSGMTWDELGRGLTTLGVSIGILALGLTAMSGSIAGSAALLIAAGALAIFAPVLISLGNMSWDSIVHGLVAIARTFAIMGVAGLLLGPITPLILALAGALALLGLATLAIGAGVGAAAAGLAALVGVVAGGATGIVAALTIIVTGIADLIPTVIGSLGEGIVKFCEAIGNGATAIGEAAKAIILTLVDVLIECVPAIADGALQLIVGVLAALATYTPQIVDSLFTFVVGLLDGLSARMPELIQSLLDVFTSLFSGVFNALMGMDTSTLVSTLAGVGLMAGIIALLGTIAPLIPGAMAGVVGMGAVAAELAVVLAAVGALNQIPGLEWLISEGGAMLTNIGNALGGFIGGVVGGIAEGFTSSLPQIGTDLSTFMTNLTPFINGAKTIDESMLTGVQAIAGIITTLTAANIMEGLTAWFTGGSSLTTFAEQLPAFGEGLKGFADNVSGIDQASVTAATTAATSLADMAGSIPNEGGLLALFSGDNNMSTFASQLPAFGEGLKGFADNVSGIDSASVATAVTAAGSLAGIADVIPNQGGLLALFSGDNDMTTFSSQLPLFAEGIKGFADKVADINTTAVETAVSAGKSLADLANNLPESGGIWSIFSADNDMSTFATEIEKFGEGLAKFSAKVAGINVSATSMSIGVAMSMKTLAESIPEDGYTQLSTFGSQLDAFGGKVKSFGSKLSKVDAEGFGSIVGSLGDLIDTISKMSDTNTGALASFDDSLGKIGLEGVKKFASAFSDGAPKVAESGRKMIDTLVKAINSKKPLVTAAVKNLVSGAANALRSEYQSFYDAGSYVGEGFADGIESAAASAIASAARMASEAAAAVRKRLLIKSPSRVFYGLGAYAGEGFVNAFGDYASKAYNASAEMATYAQKGLSNALAKVVDVVENGIDTQPTIRPVLDLSGVTDGANAINGILSMTPSVGVLAQVGAISSMMNRNQNGTNDDVIAAINDLGRKIGTGTGDTYQVNGITYDDGSNISSAVKTLVRAAKMERRT